MNDLLKYSVNAAELLLVWCVPIHKTIKQPKSYLYYWLTILFLYFCELYLDYAYFQTLTYRLVKLLGIVLVLSNYPRSLILNLLKKSQMISLFQRTLIKLNSEDSFSVHAELLKDHTPLEKLQQEFHDWATAPETVASLTASHIGMKFSEHKVKNPQEVFSVLPDLVELVQSVQVHYRDNALLALYFSAETLPEVASSLFTTHGFGFLDKCLTDNRNIVKSTAVKLSSSMYKDNFSAKQQFLSYKKVFCDLISCKDIMIVPEAIENLVKLLYIQKYESLFVPFVVAMHQDLTKALKSARKNFGKHSEVKDHLETLEDILKQVN